MADEQNGRVLVISQVPPPVHGSTVMTVTLLRALDQLRMHPQLIDRRFSSSIAQVGRFSLQKVAAGVSLLARVAAAVRPRPGVSRQPLIFFTTNRGFSLLMDTAVGLLLRIARQPYIAYVHTAGYRSIAGRSIVFKACIQFVLGGASEVVTLGPSLREDIEAFSATPPIVIPNATARRGVRGDMPRTSVLFLSNLVADKGINDFVRLAKVIADSNSFTFEVAGAPAFPTQYDKLRQDIAEAGLTERFVLHGQVDEAGREELFARSALLVFPSTYEFEAQPLTIVEALARGVAVAAYDVGGIRDLISSEFLAPRGNMQVLAVLVRDLLADPDALNKASIAALSAYEQRHSLEAFQSAWNSLLNRGNI